MSPAPVNPLVQVSKVLQPNATVPLPEKVAVLQTFATTLQGNLPMERSVQILSAVPLGLFYHGFSVEDDKLTAVLCELIQKILSPFTFEHVMSEENKPFLLQGLTHFTPEIRYLSIQQVFKCLSSDASVAMMVESDVFPLILVSIAFQDTRTANKASELLYKMSSMPSGLEAFFGPTCTMMLKQLLSVNGTISFRVYDLIIKVATLSDETFKKSEDSGLLLEFTKELQSKDLLVKINAIELLNEIATTPAGLVFLEKADLLESISAVLDNPNDNDVVVALVKCAVIKFFGNLGENKTIQFEPMSVKYHILERLEKCLDSTETEILMVTVSSVGLIGSHLAGLEQISNQQSLLEKFFEIYESSVGPIKGVFLQSLSKLISVRGDNEHVEKLTLDIFKRIQGRPSTLTSLIKEAKQPEESVRVASFALMQAIAYHAWGSQLMAQSNEFMNYILNRSTEYTEQGQTWKYAIIQTLASAPDASHIFKEYYAQLVVYIRQGAYFRPLEAIAAVESS
ncbi:26S proteasome non-ATPase regulatory subunit 5 [Mucor mucedo]|uniref:26S proteasome non-ATPase regulatory subunit 5 n=1 Tax=Mucor mucedo TaxID=29922 RepID=UPI00221FD66C|nr:26S proteasome non-ATPase regulatory subunit 5 [Mucor mucedo]KAI7891989.1 26S proteasome non-ATPase regulatory subunit 5 [Mucor mucedo]